MAQDQLDMDLMAEAELARLQRQYRIMEGDRKAFLDETTAKLSKQRRETSRLRHTKDNLMADIKVATCDGQKRKDARISAMLEKLLAEFDKVDVRLGTEKVKLDEIEQQIKKTEKQVEKLRSNQVTDEEYNYRVNSGRKTISILENRVETAVKKFCSILTQNSRLRQEIDHLLKERTRFNAIWEQLLVDLGDGKKSLLDLIEQATLAYDQREEWCSKLDALKIRAHNDVIVHTQEMREMQRELDHDGSLREFLTIKGQKRIMKDLEEKEAKRRQEDKIRVELEAKKFEETLESIRRVCGGQVEMERIAATFLKRDEENFALFNYVNELNHEVQTLTESIETMETNIDEQERTTSRSGDDDDDGCAATLAENLCRVRTKADDDEKNVERVRDELVAILHEICEIFKLMCGGDSSPILGLLSSSSSGGGDWTVDEANVMIYLGLIQKRVSHLMTDIYFRERSLLSSKPRK